MLPSEEYDSSKLPKNLLADVADTWPQGPIPYKIDIVFAAAERIAIAGGMADIMDNTCISFVDAGNTPSGDYIWITSGEDGCFVRGSGYTQGHGAHLMNLVRLRYCSRVCVYYGVGLDHYVQPDGCLLQRFRIQAPLATSYFMCWE